MNTSSHWKETATLPRFPKMNQDIKVDVVVIGAGITGVTAAYLLKRAGYQVALLERGRCGGFDTTNTTAHLTCVTDTRLHKLVREFGKSTAQAIWDAGTAAMAQIYQIVQVEKIACDYRWVPGFLHMPVTEDAAAVDDDLEEDARLAAAMGYRAEVMSSVPGIGQPGIKFGYQAKFHPLKYLGALLRTLPGKGTFVFEKTEVNGVEDNPMTVYTPGGKITCNSVVIATHTPLTGKSGAISAALMQSKLFLYTTYAVGARISRNTYPEASFWDTADPYHYLRIDRHRGFDYAILGGEDHKTGQVREPAARYRALETLLLKLLPEAKIDARWSGQVIETPDGLPYMGESAPGQFIATGFSGNGMTFGTLSAMMALDNLQQRKSPWSRVFDVSRKKVISGAWDYVRENKDYPVYLVHDWLAPAEGGSLRALRRNSGKILNLKGQKTAAYRDAKGKLSLCSPVCTHLKCIVAWNDAEKTWDCPCHGSRFSATGAVLSGPAEQPLEKLSLGSDQAEGSTPT